MTNRPLILITNDDGIRSPGLRAVASAVADLGELLIVAPNRQQTGASRSYPLNIDKTIQPAQVLLQPDQPPHPAFTADVSPAQAVALAVLNLAPRPIDLCISGINYGENIGSGVTISGTVGAAIEAACSGIPALAASLETPHEYHLSHSESVDFSTATHFVRLFAQRLLQQGLPPNVDLLKVDVPASATPETPWQTANISRQRYYQSMPGDTNNQGNPKNFSYNVWIDHDTLEPGSDVHVFAVQQAVAVVPMTIDLTAPVALPDIAKFLNGKK